MTGSVFPRHGVVKVVVGLGTLVAVLLAIDGMGFTAPLRRALQGNSGPAGLPGSNLEKIYRQLGLDPPTSTLLPSSPEEMVSSVVVDEEDFHLGWPLLSIVADEDDLYDENNGIVANPLNHGRAWERIAYVSYFEDRELVSATRAGIRMHGGATRRVPYRTSYRLYFRDVYGSDPARQSVLFGRFGLAAANLVVRDSSPLMPWANVYAFELGRRVGAIVPRVKPARLRINGEYKGQYLLTEHLHPDGWGFSWFGHRNFSYVGFRGDRKPRSVQAFEELSTWARSDTGPLSIEEAAERLDVELFTAHIFTQVFCGAGDWAQGAAVRDESRAGALWFWVLWDLDNCFLPGRRSNIEKVWERPGLDTVLASRMRDKDLRTVLFRRLLLSPEYRSYFVRRVMDWLNHRVTADFFASLNTYYRYLNSPRSRGGSVWREFAGERAAFLRKEMQERLEAGALHVVSLEAPVAARFVIDGHPEAGGYSGRYFDGELLDLQIEPTEGLALDHWLINGERLDSETVSLAVYEPMTIRPVFVGESDEGARSILDPEFRPDSQGGSRSAPGSSNGKVSS